MSHLDMIDVAAKFDWITPVVAEIQELIDGPSHHFIIDGTAMTMTPDDLRAELAHYGVSATLMSPIGDNWTFSVPAQQAQWAEYIMTQHGVMLLGGQGAPKVRRRRGARWLRWLAR